MSESDAPLTEGQRRQTWVAGLKDILMLGEGPPPVVEEWEEIDFSTPLDRFQALAGKIQAALEPRTDKLAPSKGPLHDLVKAQKGLQEMQEGMTREEDEVTEEALNQAIIEAQEAIAIINGLDRELAKKSRLSLEFSALQQKRVPLRPVVGPTWFNRLTAEATLREVNYLKGGVMSVGAEAQEALLKPFREAMLALAPHAAKSPAFALLAAHGPRAASVLQVDASGDEACARAQLALRRAMEAWQDGSEGADAGAAGQLAQAVADELGAFELAQCSRTIAAMGDDKPKQRRKDLMALCEKDPGLLTSLAATPEGRKAMDDLVKGYGGMISKKGDQAFIKALMKARFGLTQLEGDLSRKSLPRLYAIFAMVPSEHTHSNPALLAVKRKRNFQPTSWYGEDTSEAEGLGEFHMVIQGARSGGVLGWASDQAVSLHKVTKYREVKGEKTLNCLNAVTLHEIGHAVDSKEAFMASKGKYPQYGGWQKETKAHIAQVAGEDLGLFSDFADIPKTFLQELLVKALCASFDLAKEIAPFKALEGLDVAALASDPSVQATKDWLANPDNVRATADQRKVAVKTLQKKIKAKKNGKAVLEKAIADQVTIFVAIDKTLTLAVDAGLPKKVDWKALAKHKAFTWCATIKMSGGESGLWESNSKSQKAALRGRIYQEAYDGDWVSYAETARAKRVTNYQFRSEAEWFADAYSVYFSGKMPDSHPLKPWLDGQTPKHMRP